MSFSFSSFFISKLLSITTDAIINNIILDSTIQERTSQRLETLNNMIEDHYIVGYKMFWDYVKLKKMDKAIDSLLQTSNLNCTPVANYLVSALLYKEGEVEMSIEKMEQAIKMNPFVAIKSLELNDCYPLIESALTKKANNISWSIHPHEMKKKKINNVFGFLLGTPITGSVNKIKVSTSGINPTYEINFVLKKNKLGVIDIFSGERKWERHISKYDSLLFSTPLYVVIKTQEFDSETKRFQIFNSRNGDSLANFSEEKFSLLFQPHWLELLKTNSYIRYNKVHNYEEHFKDYGKNVVVGNQEILGFSPDERLSISSISVQKVKIYSGSVSHGRIGSWSTHYDYIRNIYLKYRK